MDQMSTAQFVEDFTLVADNDRDLYQEIKEIVEISGGEISTVSKYIQDNYEAAMSEAINSIENDTITDLMRQLLMGWGQTAFDKIATHYIEMFKGEQAETAVRRSNREAVADEAIRQRKGKKMNETNCGACGLFFGEAEADGDGYHRSDFCDAADEESQEMCGLCGNVSLFKDGVMDTSIPLYPSFTCSNCK